MASCSMLAASIRQEEDEEEDEVRRKEKEALKNKGRVALKADVSII